MGSCEGLPQPLTLSVETQVVAATLYLDQARVTRRGQISLTAGRHTLSFATLPGTLQPDSVRLSGQPPGLHLRDVTVQALPQSPATTQEAALTKALQVLEREYQRAQAVLTRLSLQRDFLQDLAQRTPHAFASGLAQHQVGLEEAEALLVYLGRTCDHLLDAIAQGEAHKRTLDQQLQKARKALEQLHAVPHPGYRVLASVDSHEAGTYAFDLIYLVGGVRWQPEYQARLTTAAATLCLTRLATVEQASGEDWTDVSLQFVTGHPAAVTPATALFPWPLTLPPQFPGKGRPGFQSRSPSLEEAYRMLGAVPGSEMPALEERGTLGQASDRLVSPFPRASLTPSGQFTLPSQPQSTRLELDSQCLSGELIYLALPQAANHPYVQGTFSPPLESVLPGPIKLFRDGVYLGDAQLPAMAPGQPLTLVFGLDDQVRLTHRLTLHTRTPGPVRRETLGYTLSLTNAGPEPQKCQVKVQIPVSQQDQILVSLTQAVPDVSPSEEGHCCWFVSLPAQGEQQIQYQFTVVGPEDALIVGLDG